jgi:hypothetical protein
MVQGASRESVGHFLEILTYSQRSLCRFLRCSDDGLERLIPPIIQNAGYSTLATRLYHFRTTNTPTSHSFFADFRKLGEYHCYA